MNEKLSSKMLTSTGNLGLRAMVEIDEWEINAGEDFQAKGWRFWIYVNV